MSEQALSDGISPAAWDLIHEWVQKLDPCKRMLIEELLRGGMVFMTDSHQIVKQCGCIVLARAFNLLRGDELAPMAESTFLHHLEVAILMRSYVGAAVLAGEAGDWPVIPHIPDTDEDEHGDDVHG